MAEQVDPRDEAPTTPGIAPESIVTPAAPLDPATPVESAEPAVEAGEAAPAGAAAPAKRPVGRPRKVAPEVTESPVKAAPAKAPVAKTPAAKVVPAKPAPKAAPAAAPLAATPALPVTEPAEVAKNKSEKTPAQTSAAAPLPVKATASRKEQTIMTATTTEFTDKFQAAIKDATEKAKAAFEKSQASFGDVTAFAKGNVEAIVESSKILATGLQEIGKGYVTESKSAVETLTTEIKDLTTVKSPTEFFEKQSALLRKHFDAAVAASSKNSEAFLKLAGDAFQPISNRVSLAVEKIKQAA